MGSLDIYRFKVSPVTDSVSGRPFWSVMIPTYNCASYLRETLVSVLVQDPGHEFMQIEVVDDCSTKDDPASVVEELGKGRVGFYRQPVNVGHTKNFETCLNRSRGKLVHLLHGDDRVLPGFYTKMAACFYEYPEAGAAFCRHAFIDESDTRLFLSEPEENHTSILADGLLRLAEYQHIQTPSIVVKREVYETLGGFDSRLSWTEDWEMWVRIAAHYPIVYEPSIMAEYRMHSNSNTGQFIRTGANIKDLKKAVAFISEYTPVGHRKRIREKSFIIYANYALNTASQLLHKHHDKKGATAQLIQAFSLNRSPRFVFYILKLWIKTLLLFYGSKPH